jgi:hypothetical protein
MVEDRRSVVEITKHLAYLVEELRRYQKAASISEEHEILHALKYDAAHLQSMLDGLLHVGVNCCMCHVTD